jgi:hypothetical protein
LNLIIELNLDYSMDIKEVAQQITIKMPFSAEGKEEFSTKALLSWNVKQLKEHLEKTLSSNPAPDSQKLILSGRILQDQLLLKDCFKSVPKDCLPVLHLVCSRAVLESPCDNGGVSTPDSTEGLRHRNVSENSQIFVNPQVPSAEAPPNYSSPIFDQQAMMFQMYQNYMQQYMMGFGDASGAARFQLNTGVPFPAFPQPFLQHAAPFAVPQFDPQPNHHHHPIIAVVRGHNMANIQADRAGLPPVGVNPQINDDENNHWDLLDWGYMILRVLLLLGLVFFYSSTTRFFSAFTMLALFLVFNTIRDFRRWRERYIRQQRQAPDAAPPAGENPAAANPAAGDAAPAQEEQHHGLISTVFNIVVGFVASLIPENVAQAVAN